MIETIQTVDQTVIFRMPASNASDLLMSATLQSVSVTSQKASVDCVLLGDVGVRNIITRCLFVGRSRIQRKDQGADRCHTNTTDDEIDSI